jgi:hypothetical protein
MLKRFLAVAAAMVVVLSFVTGCDTDQGQQRSVITIASMNCSAPAYSDVILDTGSIADTWAPVVFENRPYNSLVTTEPGSPHGDFEVGAYMIEWRPLDGGAALETRVEQTSFTIPSGEFGGGYIRLVGLADKVSPVLTPLQVGGIRVMHANITFYGRETGTERLQEIETGVTVEFANFDDDSVEECDLTF